jgi:hypothetical protein
MQLRSNGPTALLATTRYITCIYVAKQLKELLLPEVAAHGVALFAKHYKAKTTATIQPHQINR